MFIRWLARKDSHAWSPHSIDKSRKTTFWGPCTRRRISQCRAAPPGFPDGPVRRAADLHRTKRAPTPPRAAFSVPYDQAARDRWMRLMNSAFGEAALPAEAEQVLREFLDGMSGFMINRAEL